MRPDSDYETNHVASSSSFFGNVNHVFDNNIIMEENDEQDQDEDEQSYVDMYPNEKGEYEQQHPRHGTTDYPQGMFQEDDLQTADLPLDHANFGSYRMISDKERHCGYGSPYDNNQDGDHDDGYHHRHHAQDFYHDAASSPIMPDGSSRKREFATSSRRREPQYAMAVDYSQGTSPIMPDYHQNVFNANLMCVGGGNNGPEQQGGGTMQNYVPPFYPNDHGLL